MRSTASLASRRSRASRMPRCSLWSRSREATMARMRRCSAVNSSRNSSGVCSITVFPDAIEICRWNSMLTRFSTSSSSKFCSAVVSSRLISFRCEGVACSTAAAMAPTSRGCRVRRRSSSSRLVNAPEWCGLASTKTSSVRLTYTPEPWRIDTNPMVSRLLSASRTVGCPTRKRRAISMMGGSLSPWRYSPCCISTRICRASRSGRLCFETGLNACVNRAFLLRRRRPVETVVVLQPDGRDRDSLVSEPPDQLDGALPLGRALELVVVVVQLRVGVGLVGKPERRGEVVLSQNREPGGASQRAVVVERLVHDVPALDPAAVAPHHGVDVVAQAGEQRVPADGVAPGVLEHPARRLLVPDQVMPHDEHPVPLAERDVAVGGGEVVAPATGMHRAPLEHVLGRDRVELRLHDAGSHRIDL